PIILIAGGRTKGSDFSEWAGLVKERVKRVILLGEAAPLLEQVLTDTGYYNIERVVSLEEAVAAAYRTARAGECVLLSPACASWDMFSSYEERGRAFKEAVAQLGRGRK
ncbi:MAG TPA: UDP-N-acetylmuramoyl-L-alanine--D-glutamate ligase, partial [Firmicutes bacterium]|nr:UDP-N-acetylmuramoyl-L-alanine--D-glutamate ligase [Bacillota bacterium]